MKTLIAFVSATLISLNLYGESTPPRLVGSWSNKKSGFEIITVSFRADGKGRLMFAGVGEVPLKWENQETNIHVRMGGAFDLKELDFSLGPLPDSIQAVWFDGVTQIFHQVSASEPPDIEARAREAREKEWNESRKHFNVLTNDAHSLADLPSCIEGFMQPSPLISHLTLAVGGTNVVVTMQRTRTNTFLNVTTKFAGDRSRDFSTTGMWANSPPNSTWPEIILVKDSDVSELVAWLAARGMTADFNYCIYRDEWGLRFYEHILHIHIPMDSAVIDTLIHVLTTTLNEVTPPYTMVVSTPKNCGQGSP